MPWYAWLAAGFALGVCAMIVFATMVLLAGDLDEDHYFGDNE